MEHQPAWNSLSGVPTEIVALLNALHRRHPTSYGLRNLSDQQWKRLLRFSDLAHLTLPLAMRFDDALPAWVSQRLVENLADNRKRFQRIRSTYLEAANTLEQAAVPHVVLKGFTLTPDYASSPYVRQQSDLDLYCPSEFIQAAQVALKSIGYEPETELNYSYADHSPTLLRLGSWNWRDNAFDPTMPLSLELHFCLWNEKVSLLSFPEINQFWDRQEHRRIEGMNVPVLSPIDQLGYFSMHILRNLLGRDSVVHHVYELANFLDNRSVDQAFWSKWTRVHSYHLRRHEVIVFDLARQWFGCNLPETVERMIEDLRATQHAWLQHFGKSPIEGAFVENKDVVWLHWSLLERNVDKIKLLRKTFIPNRMPNPNCPAVVMNERTIISSAQNRFLSFLSYTSRRMLSYSLTHLRTLYRGMLWLMHREVTSKTVV